jgi:ribosomal protein S12 methylthiotransferase accessory factor
VTASPPDATARSLSDRWLVAALGSGLVLVGPGREAEIDLAGARPGPVLAALTPAIDAAALARELPDGAGDAADLIALLEELGAVGEDACAATDVLGLAPALRAVRAGEALTGAAASEVATADELLILPPGLTRAQERRALHAFVASVRPDPRQRVYCDLAATGQTPVRGDLPDRDALELARALAAERPNEIVVVGLGSGDVAALAPDRLDAVGFDAPHRLGPLTDVAPLARADATDDMQVYAARYALANLGFATSCEARIGGGRARDPALAELIARAEAAERYASGDLNGHTLLRAREADLDAPFVGPGQLFRGNARQLRRDGADEARYDPADEHLWIAGADGGGERRWVPAAAVFFPFRDPLHPGFAIPTTSSGAAAYSTYAGARLRAISELVERDAFTWTWVQRVGRELIEEGSLPSELRARVAALTARGHSVAFVNLTLDLLPVIACAVHSESRLGITLACDPDAATAARRAFDEGSGLLDVAARGRLESVPVSEVRSPEHHAALYDGDPDRVAGAAFFWSSHDRMSLAEVAPPGDPLERAGEGSGFVTVDLTTASSAPFHVARAVAPGLVPISFGYDREPLGMPALAEPRATHDGRTLGAHLDLAEAGPLDPHPFA